MSVMSEDYWEEFLLTSFTESPAVLIKALVKTNGLIVRVSRSNKCLLVNNENFFF